tara:strand:+ start:382 stop:1380 length:999 start_codon:yes stop_codon:yes gene_type:complete
MTKTIRLGGAQIPVHHNDIQYNKNEILRALDWAVKNKVDYLLTPECALSGYKPDWVDRWDELKDALNVIQNYQKRCGVGLHLGTYYKEPEYLGDIHRNQIRHYDKDGKLVWITNKTYIINGERGAERVILAESDPCQLFSLPYAKKATGLICNDMWGEESFKDHTPNKPISEVLIDKRPNIIIHATNGVKYESGVMRRFYGKSDRKGLEVQETMNAFHDGYLRQVALTINTSIFTVDSCTSWSWDGDEDEVDKVMTATESGVINPLGAWQTKTPRFGRQYFYYDYDVATPEKFTEKGLLDDDWSLLEYTDPKGNVKRRWGSFREAQNQSDTI